MLQTDGVHNYFASQSSCVRRRFVALQIRPEGSNLQVSHSLAQLAHSPVGTQPQPTACKTGGFAYKSFAFVSRRLHSFAYRTTFGLRTLAKLKLAKLCTQKLCFCKQGVGFVRASKLPKKDLKLKRYQLVT